jgi:ribosomal protein S18 acetylase RimI-like enzyme
MKIRQAIQQDLHEVMDLIRSCVQHMEAQGIQQWDEIYPDETTFAGDIERYELYLLEKEGRIRGFIALNEFQEPAYQDVQWQFSGKALVVHRLSVDPAAQGQGYARELMQFAYEFAGTHIFETIRLDAYSGNPRAVALYERLGYQKAGTVMFRKGPFYCFEIEVV